MACGARTDLGGTRTEALPDANFEAAHDGPADVFEASDVIDASKQGFALHFNGADVATVEDDASLHLDAGTIEMWFRVDAIPGAYQALIAKSFSNGTDDSFAIWLQDGTLLAGTNVTSPAGAVSFPWTPDGAWHFVAWTFESNNAESIFFDGASVATSANTQTPQYDDHPVLFGADFGGTSLTGFFDGDIDELRIWNTMRSSSDIASDMYVHPPMLASGMVALWTFDEGTGQIAHDATGSHDAVLGTSANSDASDPTWITSPF